MKAFIRKYWVWILVSVVAIGGIFLWRQSANTKRIASSVTTAKVKQGDFVKTLSSSGKTKADKSVDLRFQTSGVLAWVNVKEGDVVDAYQAIAGLDTREVQNNLTDTLRDYSSDRNDFEETWRVTYDGKTAEQAFDDTAKRILEKNQWDLDKAVLDVELKHLALEYATIVTPIAGVVTRVDRPVAGINITPATAIFTISDPESIIFEATVDETDVGDLTVGQKASIALDAFPEATFSGTISYISYNSEQSSGGATVFPVKIAFQNPSETLRLGLNGDIEIITDQQENVLTVPSGAVRHDDDKTYVYKKSDKTFEKVYVTAGIRNEDDIIIDAGLSKGDIVVTKGFSHIPK